MPTKSAAKSPEEPDQPEAPPTDPEEARKAFLRGDLRWNDYVNIANAAK